MAKQKYAKEIHEHWITWFAIAIVFAISVGTFIGVLELKNRMDSMPHWECHNEVEYGKVIPITTTGNLNQALEGFFGSSNNFECIYDSLNTQYLCTEIKSIEEVCEIV